MFSELMDPSLGTFTDVAVDSLKTGQYCQGNTTVKETGLIGNCTLPYIYHRLVDQCISRKFSSHLLIILSQR